MNLYELDASLRDFTAHQFKILEVLYNAGGQWLTRIQLARALSKQRLTPYDINCLKMMTDRGLIHTSTQPTSAPGSDFAYIYSMSDDIAYLLQDWAEIREQMRAEIARKRPPLQLVSKMHSDTETLVTDRE